MAPSSPIRVVVAKPGLDGHDRGAKVVARALRDAGIEVIYTGLHQTPEQIIETAIQEDADAVGLSVLSGAHMTLFQRVVDLLRERDAGDIVVFGGGIIPDADIPELKKIGVAEVFTPGTPTHRIVDWVVEHVGSVTRPDRPCTPPSTPRPTPTSPPSSWRRAVRWSPTSSSRTAPTRLRTCSGTRASRGWTTWRSSWRTIRGCSSARAGPSGPVSTTPWSTPTCRRRRSPTSSTTAARRSS